MDTFKKNDTALTVGLIIRILSWLMIPVALVTVIMTFLASFSLFVTDFFDTSQTLLTVLLITFLLWTVNSILDSKHFPTYRIYSVMFAAMSVVAAYLLSTKIF